MITEHVLCGSCCPAVSSDGSRLLAGPSDSYVSPQVLQVRSSQSPICCCHVRPMRVKRGYATIFRFEAVSKARSTDDLSPPCRTARPSISHRTLSSAIFLVVLMTLLRCGPTGGACEGSKP